jgi:hypothetical protein
VIALPERAPRAPRETPITRACIIALNRLPGVRAARNNNGSLEDARGQWVTFGLGDGSPDIVCRVQVRGKGGTLPCVFWVEVKAPGARTSRKRAELQRAWRLEAEARGELVAQVTSVLDAVAAAETFCAEYRRRVSGVEPLAPCELPSGPLAHDGGA